MSSTLRPALLSALLLAPLATSCSSTSDGRADRVDWLIRHGSYAEAVDVAAERVDAKPGDPVRQKEHRRATAAYLLDQARGTTLRGEDELALEFLDEARAVAPDNIVVENWVEKISGQLAEDWLDRALDLEGQGELDAALEAFERALEHRPDDELAQLGAARILVIKNYRAGLGEEYYQEGVRRLRDAFLHQARQSFDYAGKYLVKKDRAKDRSEIVQRQLAEERAAMARRFEAEGLFDAARNEYRLVLLLDEDNESGIEGLERTTVEAEASQLLGEADMLVRRGRLDEAREAANEGAAITEQQVVAFESMLIDIVEREYRKIYDRAYDLETDFLYEEAAAVYGDLLEKAEYFEDAIARKETLEGYIKLADQLYAKAQAAETDQAKLDLLRQIDVFWPEYRDLQKLLRELDSAE